jgi:hypothetical protein
VFSHVVLEALEKAPVNEEGLMEVTGLITFVEAELPSKHSGSGRSRRPSLADQTLRSQSRRTT